MLETCKICRRGVALGQGTMISAGGRQLFVVHRDPCAAVVRDGVQFLGRAAVRAGLTVLDARAPGALRLLGQVRTLLAGPRQADIGPWEAPPS